MEELIKKESNSMKETPILLNTEMVKAVLDGRKSQTRRVIKPSVKECTVGAYTGSKIEPVNVQPDGDPWTDIKCPYGKVDDLLWVRENWCVHKNYDEIKPSLLPEKKYLQQGVTYLADVHNGEKSLWMGKTRPSIFMPKKYARIWLKIKEIRVERLKDISEDDARYEGLYSEHDGHHIWFKNYLDHGPDFYKYYSGARKSFASLWDSINGKRASCAWNYNPWVWVVDFERIEK